MFRHQIKLNLISLSLFAILLLSASVVAQPPTPKDVLGFYPTTSRTIADWKQITNYFEILDKKSERVVVKNIGTTELGKPMIAVFISSEANIKDLESIRKINEKLADPRKIKDENEAALLIKNGKTVVSISCSIHSTEIVASQMSLNLAYELATAKDAETLNILDNTVLILIPSSNPDGIDIVADWYRKTLGTKSEGTSPPELYHHYAGHDNNRDWFMMNLKETRAITKLYWQQWFPHIVYDVHQMGQNGARFIIPPFFDPPNPNIAPLVLREVGLMGYKMATDLQSKNIAGVATNTTFDTWWHGGFRSAPYYHNSIGILSEAASANLMSPVNITAATLERARPARGLTSPAQIETSHPDPWKGGEWKPENIAEIEMSASRSALEMAAKFRERYLRNFYSLNKANTLKKDEKPIAYIIPAGQPNAQEVTRFLEILMWQGIEVFELKQEVYMTYEKGQTDFHEMPLGSFIVFTDQPQRNNIFALFETQNYPHRVNAAGEPDVPYDVAGWTLPLQMGIETMETLTIRNEEMFRKTLIPVKNADQIREVNNLQSLKTEFAKLRNPLKTKPRVGLFKSTSGQMDEGWTRLVFDTYQIPFGSVTEKDVRDNKIDVDVLVIPSQNENSIVNGLPKERYPEEFSGGIGESGKTNLKAFVENGGKIVCFDASCGMVIKMFDLPVKNVLDGKKRSEFYNPGSIVKLEVDTKHALAKGTYNEMPAYFINSSAFEVTDFAKVRTVAQYALKNVLLSGWMLGDRNIIGKSALVESDFGQGKIVMFAFRPQHRGQTFATFPFIFNALEK